MKLALSSTPLLTAGRIALTSALLVPLHARAETIVEYNTAPETPASIDLFPDWIPAPDEEGWNTYAEILNQFWKPQLKKKFRRHRKFDESLVSSKLVVQMMAFANDFSGRSQSFAKNYRSQFLRSIHHGAPNGFAWFVMIEKIGYDIENFKGSREGGGIGVQLPVAGSKDLWLKANEGQLVLRVLPLAGNYEQVKYRDGQMKTDPSGGIIFRPTLELEGTYQIGHYMTPGFRLLAQPKALEPTQTRMIAEVSFEVSAPLYGTRFSRISVVPRCMIDVSTDQTDAEGRDASGFGWAYALLNRNTSCSAFAKFSFGL